MGQTPSKPSSSSSGASPSLASPPPKAVPARRDSVHLSTSPDPASCLPDASSSPPTQHIEYAQPTLHSSAPKPRTYSHRLTHHQSASAHESSAHSHRRDMGNTASHQAWKDKQDTKRREREQELQSHPVTVPGLSHERQQRDADAQFKPSGPPRDPNFIPPSTLNFPPRVPLPISEEVHTPGSPIISPADLSSILHEDEVDGVLPRRSSILSQTTADEDELEDETQGYGQARTQGRTVPTLIEWKHGGGRVYITGTFTSWSRKYRMHRNPDTQVLSTVLDLPPGTHHVKFIVDGEMQLSKELPTAVDWTNILVNYIEVSADDIPKKNVKQKIPDDIFPPLVLPPGIETKDPALDSADSKQAVDGDNLEKPVWHGDAVPAYLLDLDREEQTNRFRRAAGSIQDIPTPPSIPQFLIKSILNGATPLKDDSSVLNIPNYTVLNHLATSSIKDDVLATSLTTRYKRKHVTTIMYRPTNADRD